MRASPWNLLHVGDDVLVFHRFDAPQGATRMSEGHAASLVADWLRSRPNEMRDIHRASGLDDRAPQQALEEAFRRGDLVAFRMPLVFPLRRVERPTEPPNAAEPTVDEPVVHELAIELIDPWGRPLEGQPWSFVLADGSEHEGVYGDAEVRRTSSVAGRCEVKFPPPRKKLEREAPDLDEAPDPFATATSHRTLTGPWKLDTRSVAHRFQLVRSVATVVEIDHFTTDGAVVLPGSSPAPQREGAEHTSGIAALGRAIALGAVAANVLVTGHHASLSNARAENVAAMLTADRDGWSSHAMQHANSDDRAAIRAFVIERLPADEAWTLDTWKTVFDAYQRALAPRAPKPRQFKLVVRGPNEERESIYPVKMAEITFGPSHAARAQELEALNPSLVRGRWDWRPIHPGDEIVMPESWPPEPLMARGFKIVAVDDVPPPRAPRLTKPPKVVGCAARHVQHPQADALERRAIARAVEVMMLPADDPACASASCDTHTCKVYDPLEYALTYVPIDPAAPTLPWSAAWDRAQVGAHQEAKMELIAPGLADGETVLFEVSQVGVGRIADLGVSALGGRASLPFRDWFHPRRVGARVSLEAGQPFPEARFTFTAVARGRRTKASAPVVYRDRLAIRARYSIENDAFHAHADARAYVLHTPWGTRAGTTGKGAKAGWIVEEGLPPGGASVVLGAGTLLATDADGALTTHDRSGAIGSSHWWRFCDTQSVGDGFAIEYRFLAGSPTLEPPTDTSPSEPQVSFRVLRLVTADAPRDDDLVLDVAGTTFVVADDQTHAPAPDATDPWLWRFTQIIGGGSGFFEVRVSVDGVEKIIDRIWTGLPVEPEKL